MTNAQHRASVTAILLALTAPASAITGTIQAVTGLWIQDPIHFADPLTEAGREVALALAVGWTVAGVSLTAFGATLGVLSIGAAARVRILRADQALVISALGGAGLMIAAPVLIASAVLVLAYGLALVSDLTLMWPG